MEPSLDPISLKNDFKNSRKLESSWAILVREEKLLGREGISLSILLREDDGKRRGKSCVISVGIQISYMTEKPYGRKK